MKKLNITKEQFEKSKYFKNKYGNLEYVSESGNLFKTNKGKVLMFKESKEFKELLDDYLSKIDFNDPSSLGGEQGFSGNDLRKMGYTDLDDYWRQKDSEVSAAQAKQIESGVMIYRTNRFGDLWTIKTIDGGLHLKDKIKGFNRAMKIAQKNGWKVVKTIPKNTKAVKESDKKFGKKFAKESFDDTEKEFTYKGVTITRYDYESLPDPMAASKLDDKTMQRIAYDIYDYLASTGWEDDEIAKYLGSNLDEILDDDWKGEQIKDEFWQYMEKAALDNGMEYYEDMPEDEM